jgi:mRNA interferase MazF
VSFTFEGKRAWIVLDQIRTVDRKRLHKELGRLDERHVGTVKKTIKEMLVE